MKHILAIQFLIKMHSFMAPYLNFWMTCLTRLLLTCFYNNNLSLLTLYAPALQNSQTHSNNSSAFADELFKCVWPFRVIGALRVKVCAILQNTTSSSLYITTQMLNVENLPVVLNIQHRTSCSSWHILNVKSSRLVGILKLVVFNFSKFHRQLSRWRPPWIVCLL